MARYFDKADVQQLRQSRGSTGECHSQALSRSADQTTTAASGAVRLDPEPVARRPRWVAVVVRGRHRHYASRRRRKLPKAMAETSRPDQPRRSSSSGTVRNSSGETHLIGPHLV